MDDIDLLQSVLNKTGDIVAGVGEEQLGLPTPCPEFDVAMLRNHIVAWVQVFDAGCHGRTVPFTDDEATRALALAETTLPDEYRSGAFGPRIAVPVGSPGVDRFVAFMSRQPSA